MLNKCSVFEVVGKPFWNIVRKLGELGKDWKHACFETGFKIFEMRIIKSCFYVHNPKTVAIATPRKNAKMAKFWDLNFKFLKFPSYPRESPVAGGARDLFKPNYRLLAKSNDVFFEKIAKNRTPFK